MTNNLYHLPSTAFCCHSALLLLQLFYRAIIGEIDDEVDNGLDMTSIKAEPLNPVVY